MTASRLQRTISDEISMSGVAFLSGADVHLTFRPAEPGTGIVFVRTDTLSKVRIAAHVRNVVHTDRRTALAVGDVRVEMVEHVLAALSGLGIDNCEIDINAPELPGCDGSSLAFVECLQQVRLVDQSVAIQEYKLDEPLSISGGGASIAALASPSDSFVLSYHLHYGDHSPIIPQSRWLEITENTFASELAAARTFLLKEEAELLRSQGLGARVHSTDLLIFGPHGPIQNQLRFPDEPVRHKILDMVGDLKLMGFRLQAHVTASRSGHRLNVALARRLVERFDPESLQTPTTSVNVPLPDHLSNTFDTGYPDNPPDRMTENSMPTEYPTFHSKPALRVGVVGVGHMGKHHARILNTLEGAKLTGIADRSSEQVGEVSQQLNVNGYTDFRELFPHVDAVTIAVPSQHHATIAEEFLSRKIPVLIEKPIATTAKEADAIVSLAQTNQTVLQVGHCERFNPTFVALSEHVNAPKYIQADRLGPFSNRSTDIGVILDLMVHDLELVLALTQASPIDVQGIGISVFGKHEDIATARVTFDDGCVATFNASRAHLSASRKMQVWTQNRYFQADFVKHQIDLMRPQVKRDAEQKWSESWIETFPEEQHWKSVPVTETWPVSFQNRRIRPAAKEPLREELQEFLDCVRSGRTPTVDGIQGCKAVSLANKILQVIQQHFWDGTLDGPVGPHLHRVHTIPSPHWDRVTAPVRSQDFPQ
ncbi:MAG: UDP-3-O-acyl-N-acetylglucosamine deacetylase [Planctomycetota bacterium]|nr:UDP-3-O-acyl-N-acetylglucosamine deacetylase [Planctomycetota bacterium]